MTRRFLGISKKVFMEITRNSRKTEVYSGLANSAYVHLKVVVEFLFIIFKDQTSIENFEYEFSYSLSNSFISISLIDLSYWVQKWNIIILQSYLMAVNITNSY